MDSVTREEDWGICIGKPGEWESIAGCGSGDGDSAAFREVTDMMCDTFGRKNHDYGNSFGELFEECGMVYAYGHLKEKLNRVRALMGDAARVGGESMEDSLLDLACYAVLTLVELRKRGDAKDGKEE